jgi:hypothetical protein
LFSPEKSYINAKQQQKGHAERVLEVSCFIYLPFLGKIRVEKTINKIVIRQTKYLFAF